MTRHDFLFLAGGAGLAQLPAARFAALDHLILGCDNLERGITYVEERTGVRAAFGGVHPGRGTQNAVLSLGGQSYLEILAPDPKQPGVAQPARTPPEPRLVGWALHPGNLAAFANRLREAGIECQGPIVGSRARPDGRLLRWRSLNLADDRHGLLPFFIEWEPATPHPSSDSPSGCRLTDLALVFPDPSEFTRITGMISVELPVIRGDRPELRVTITGPRGALFLTSRSPQ